ncbi:MAG: YdeI/OmpD-associated family protein [Acidimicrobiales bacterium]
MRFTATLETNGKTATGIEVPETAVEQLGKGKKPPVTVTIGSHSYRSTVAVMGGRFLLPVSAENRTKAGIAAGDEVEVTLVLDEAPRQVTVPEDLAAALATDPTAKAFFEGLSFSQQRFHVDSIEGARTDETRQRRIEKSLVLLSQQKAR